MSGEIVKPKLDIVFKILFTTDLDMLKTFIADMLSIPVKKIKKLVVLNSELLPDFVDGKHPQLDLKMLVDKKIVNVEIQLSNKGDYRERAAYR